MDRVAGRGLMDRTLITDSIPTVLQQRVSTRGMTENRVRCMSDVYNWAGDGVQIINGTISRVLMLIIPFAQVTSYSLLSVLVTMPCCQDHSVKFSAK